MKLLTLRTEYNALQFKINTAARKNKPVETLQAEKHRLISKALKHFNPSTIFSTLRSK